MSTLTLLENALVSRTLRRDELATPGEPRDLPRVVEPEDGAGSFESLLAMLGERREELEALLRTSGGVLLRGWDVSDAASFEKVLRRLGWELEPEYLMGTTPRNNVAGHVFSSTEAPPDYPIFAHNEMSYLNTRPMLIAFYCAVAPRRYGETPVFDTRASLRELDPDVRRRLEERKVRYVRRLPYRRSFWQTVIHRTWPETFLTDDRAEVERIAAANGVELRWRGDTLISEVVVDPIVRHPETGEPSLNVQLYHAANLALDIENLAARQGWVENHLMRIEAALGFRTGRFPVEIRYGDGAPIPREDVVAIRTATWNNAVLFSWKRSDVLLLENLITAHARMNVEPPRKILAAFGRMVSFRPPMLAGRGAGAAVAPAAARVRLAS